MSSFYEEVLKEYKPIIKRKTFSKEVSYRIRVLKREMEGIPRLLVDIRNYIINERGFRFKEGIYLDHKELDYVIECLQDARKEFYGTSQSGHRGKNISSSTPQR